MSNIVKLGKTPTFPRRQKNSDIRSREHLTLDEVDRLMTAPSKPGRHGLRDKTLILMMYRHALRVSELIALRWDQVNLKTGALHVNRSKNGIPSTSCDRWSRFAFFL